MFAAPNGTADPSLQFSSSALSSSVSSLRLPWKLHGDTEVVGVCIIGPCAVFVHSALPHLLLLAPSAGGSP